MRKKYLPLYEKWIEAGLPKDGLCHCLDNGDKFFELMKPVHECWMVGYWAYCDGYGGPKYEVAPVWRIWHDFTPLRQNIVLFMAAMNNEL